jgi:double-strand break repair protein MRE11
MVNYTNPNMNIGLPIFSIHGNHDDPVGLGGLSAMDNLHSTGLVNYFGRINNLKGIFRLSFMLKKC